MNAKPVINFLKRRTIKFLFDMYEKDILNKIPYPQAQLLARKWHDNLKRLVELMIDKNPNDKEQFEKWWKVERKELVAEGVEVIEDSLEVIFDDIQDADDVIALIRIKLEEQKEARQMKRAYEASIA